MAIYDHKYGDLPYLRVYRSWGGKEYQEYVRIKRSRKAAYAKAQEIDARLAAEQKEFVIEQSRQVGYHVREDGTIRGLRRILVTRKGRTPVEVFELRINVPWEEQVKRTTISISVHGDSAAFQQAVAKICDWYGLSEEEPVYQAMLEQFPVYTADKSAKGVADLAIKKAKQEFANITDGLFKGLKRFTATSEEV